MKKILVTGGHGFIAKHLIKKLLLDRDIIVTSLDNNYRWDKFALQNMIEDNYKNIQVIEGDICDEKLISKLIEQTDIVVHLAAISQVETSINNPDTTFNYNIIGTKNIVKYCSQFQKKIIFASSREVYGNAQYVPVDLNHPLVQENPYGASKVISEILIKTYALNYNLSYCILRLSNVYGGGDKGRVIPIFIQKILNNENITIYGKEKIIDFIYINDVVDAFIAAINAPLKEGVFNVGSGQKVTLEELAEKIITLTGSASVYSVIPNRKGEVDTFCADIQETKKTLGREPHVDLERGLQETIAYFTSIL